MKKKSDHNLITMFPKKCGQTVKHVNNTENRSEEMQNLKMKINAQW